MPKCPPEEDLYHAFQNLRRAFMKHGLTPPARFGFKDSGDKVRFFAAIGSSRHLNIFEMIEGKPSQTFCGFGIEDPRPNPEAYYHQGRNDVLKELQHEVLTRLNMEYDQS